MTSPRRQRRLALMAITAACSAVVIAGGTASAQIGDHLLPPLENTLDPGDLLPTPLPTTPAGNEVDGVVGDAGGTIDDTLADLDDPNGGGGIEPGDEPITTEDQPPGDDEGDPGSDTSTAGAGGGTGGNGSTGDEAGTDSSTGAPASSSAADRASRAASAYGSAAARATLATATRALKLAGPLSAPLLFGLLAVIGLIALGRGSDGLLKVEPLRDAGRSYRL